jgi:hypothetical protein
MLTGSMVIAGIEIATSESISHDQRTQASYLLDDPLSEQEQDQ